jgi:hypothetical protein
MRKTFRWLLQAVLAGLFITMPGFIVNAHGKNQTASSSKKAKAQQHRSELQAQRRRIKQSRQSVRARARQSPHRGTPPKAGRHKMRKVQRHSTSPNLTRARKQNKSRQPTH